jgi:GPI mannosyltransferase 3
LQPAEGDGQMDEQGCSNVGPSRRWLCALLAIGLALRIGVAWVSPGTLHPDEHQQYIEQSFRLIHGYGSTPWEQQVGLRHPLFPMILAGILWIGERSGITDPHVLAALQRIVLGIASFAALAALALSIHARGRWVAGLVIAVLIACNVDLVFIGVRVMSENASITALAFALVCWPRRPVAAGLLLGMMVTLRLQTAPLAAGLWTIAAWEALRGTNSDSGRRCLALTAGLAVALVAAGGIDAVYFGQWFHSFIVSFRTQAVEGASSNFGTSPVYAHFLTGGAALLRISVFAFPLLIWGGRRQPALAAVALLFLIAHSAIPHKEFRFLWPVAPIICLLFAAGVEAWNARRPLGRAMCVLLIASVLLPSLQRIGSIKWRTEEYAMSCDGLARIGRSPDVHGVVLIDMPEFMAGNYFYLRAPAPIRYIRQTEECALMDDPSWQDGRLNYVFAPREGLTPVLQHELRCIAEYGKWAVYTRETDKTRFAVRRD